MLKKISPDKKTRDYYSLRYIDNYLDWVPKQSSEAFVSSHGITIFLVLSFAFISILIALAIAAGSFFIQINVIYDMAVTPSSFKYIDIFLVTYCLSAILLSWLITILQFPMPEVDSSNYLKLDVIKENNPEKYERLLKKAIKNDAKNVSKLKLLFNTLRYSVIFSVVSIFIFPETLDNLYTFVYKAIYGLLIILFLTNEIMSYIDKKAMFSFFSNLSNEISEKKRLNAFTKRKKELKSLNLIISVLLTFIYTFWSLGSL